MGNKLPHAKGDVFQGKNIYIMFSYKKKEESKLKLSISTFKTNVFEIVTTIPQTQELFKNINLSTMNETEYKNFLEEQIKKLEKIINEYNQINKQKYELNEEYYELKSEFTKDNKIFSKKRI